MNTILKNEEFLLKLEDRIIKKLADKIVDKVITDQDFSVYLQEDSSKKTVEEPKKKAAYRAKDKTEFEEYLQAIKKPPVEDVLAGIRSVGALDEIPTSVKRFTPTSFSEFVEKKKDSQQSTSPKEHKPLNSLESDEEKIEATMDKFENSIKKLIEQGKISDVKNLDEFYKKVDTIIKKTQNYSTFSIPAGVPAASPEDRDKVYSSLRDARALSTFSSQSEAMAEALFMERVNRGRFKINQTLEDDNIKYQLAFDFGVVDIEDKTNTETGRREMKITNFVLFEKAISDFKLSDNKIREVVDILESKMIDSVLNPIEHKELTKSITTEQILVKDKKLELEKQKVKFMSPEFLQAIL